MKIKKSIVLNLEQVLTSMLQTAMAPVLAFKVASNSVSVSECAEMIKKSYKPVDGFDEYEGERKALLEDVAGASPDGRYSLTPDQATEFNSRLESIDKKYKDVIASQKVYAEKFNEMLDEKTDIKIEKLNTKDMTADIEPSKMVVLIQSGILGNGSK